MKRFLAVLTALIMLFTLFSAVALAAGTESESMMTDRADDPASYDTAEGLRVQRYIIVALFHFSFLFGCFVGTFPLRL